MKSDTTSQNWLAKKTLQFGRTAEVRIAGTYFLLFVLVLIPYYNWFYRVLVNSLHNLFFWILLAVTLLLIPIRLFRKQLNSILILLIIAGTIYFLRSHVDNWRYLLTDHIIQTRHCEIDSNSLKLESQILGGINEIGVDGSTKRMGVFENSSHCLIVVCLEEFYYCTSNGYESHP